MYFCFFPLSSSSSFFFISLVCPSPRFLHSRIIVQRILPRSLLHPSFLCHTFPFPVLSVFVLHRSFFFLMYISIQFSFIFLFRYFLFCFLSSVHRPIFFLCNPLRNSFFPIPYVNIFFSVPVPIYSPLFMSLQTTTPLYYLFTAMVISSPYQKKHCEVLSKLL